MSILLYAPAIAIVLLKRGGFFKTLAYFSAVALIQVTLSWEFLSNFPWEYLKGSFDFSRQFLYQWTVNWKMLPEEFFLSSQLAGGLLACHAITLLILGHFFWCGPEGGLGRLLLSALRHPALPSSKSSPTSEGKL
jgi:alpha-1,3-mannosyltransferase